MLKAVLLKVFDLAGSETDHIPPVMVSSYMSILVCLLKLTRNENGSNNSSSLCFSQYDFEISNAKSSDDRDEVYSRVSNLPALINLGS